MDCPTKYLLGQLLLLNWSDLKSLLSWRTIFALPLPNYWSSSTLLYLSIQSMSWRRLVTGFPIRDFLKPCSARRLLLKVLMATSSKLPSISLYISQYLSEYAFRISPSHMDKDSRESKDRGTLLHVMKREPKAWVSCLKEPMEFGFRPSNHLITIGPKLDGNTLHIKASSLEWTAILWLNWLTCSTGSVQPLYMVNVGWWNRRGSLAPSILCVKGDLEIRSKALLMVSFPRPLWDRLLYLRLWWCSSS